MRCSIVPPYLLARLAAIEDRGLEHVAAAAQAALAIDEPRRCARGAQPAPPSVRQAAPRAPARQLKGPQRTIFDAGHVESLPGTTVRTEGQPVGDDASVTEAYDGLGSTHALYRFAYARASIDDNNLPLLASVHYGRAYDNAFWNGEQMVFGDGDGTVFRGFTSSLTVVGHELTHGVTQYSANSPIRGSPGRSTSPSRMCSAPWWNSTTGAERRGGELAHRRGLIHRSGAGQGAALDERSGHGVRR